MVNGEVDHSANEQVECSPHGESESSDGSVCLETDQKGSLICINSEAVREHHKHNDVAVLESIPSVVEEASNGERELCFGVSRGASGQEQEDTNINIFGSRPSISNGPDGPNGANMDVTNHQSCEAVVDDFSPCLKKDLSVSDREATQEVAEDTHNVNGESRASLSKDVEIYVNGLAHEDESALQVEHVHDPDSALQNLDLKWETNFQEGNGVKSVELMDDS